MFGLTLGASYATILTNKGGQVSALLAQDDVSAAANADGSQ